MQEMMDFILWFVEKFPDILLTPPISMFTSLAILGWMTDILIRLFRLGGPVCK